MTVTVLPVDVIVSSDHVTPAPCRRQFLGMGEEQRGAIRRALNEDAAKLIEEGEPTDGQLRRLRREIDEVNALFEEFERLAAEGQSGREGSGMGSL